MAPTKEQHGHSQTQHHNAAGKRAGLGDFWSPEVYATVASFVPSLGAEVVDKCLHPEPGDRILDIGCGDGVLTRAIAARVFRPDPSSSSSPTALPKNSGYVLGIDGSKKMIQAANEDLARDRARLEAIDSAKPATGAGTVNVFYDYRDCAVSIFDDGYKEGSGESKPKADSSAAAANVDHDPHRLVRPNTFDKVFSNATFHWILAALPRPLDDSAVKFFKSVRAVLKPGGTFAFDLPGFGNMGELQTAFVAVLKYKYGLSWKDANESVPYFFPSDWWMRQILARAGFDVHTCELVLKPTKIAEPKEKKKKEEGGGAAGAGADDDGDLDGLVEWLHFLGPAFLSKLEEDKKEDAYRETARLLKQVMRREDGNDWVAYIRLRVMATKPADARD